MEVYKIPVNEAGYSIWKQDKLEKKNTQRGLGWLQQTSLSAWVHNFVSVHVCYGYHIKKVREGKEKTGRANALSGHYSRLELTYDILCDF